MWWKGKHSTTNGFHLQHLLTKIKDRFSALNQFRAQKLDAEITRLETIYAQANWRGKASLREALRATRHVVAAQILSIEFYFFLVGVTLLALVSGTFVMPGAEYDSTRFLIVFISMVLATAIPVIMAFITTPFNLLYTVGMAVLTPACIVLSTIIMSLVQPPVITAILGHEVPGFWDLIPVMLVIYAFTLSYLMLQQVDRLSYTAYKIRHKSPGLESLLPLKLHGRLVSLSAQDHYVEIVTEHGRHLQRMPFSEAVEMARNEKGMQIHRSHWAACNAMIAMEKKAERYFVKLHTGTVLPVAKSRVAQLTNYLANR